MKKPFIISSGRLKGLALALLSCSLVTAPAFAGSSPLVDLVLEKRVIGDLHRGPRPMIDPSSYQAEPFALTSGQYGPLHTVSQPTLGAKGVIKRYEVASEPEHYQSLIRIYDAATGQQRGQLNVGRRIQSLVASPTSNRLYVLCGGYFGSVWEIDTARDMVLRKLPGFIPEETITPLWNPKNMVLLADGKTLAVGSDKLHLIDLTGNRLTQALDLPEGMVEVSSLQALPGNLLGVGLRDAKGGYQRYQVLPQGVHYALVPGGGAAAGQRSLRVQVRTYSAPQPAVSRLFFMASRNNDYVRMIDRNTLTTVGVLPVDFAVDDLVLTPDHKRLFVYNRRFGQVSVIELNARSPQTFSVIKRYQDQRFQVHGTAPTMQLGAAAGQVFLWDGENQIVAGFDSFNLYPRMDVSFGVKLNPPMSSPVWVAQPAHQRFYTREGKLYAEFVDADPSNLPIEIALGAPVQDLQLSTDRRRLYALTQNAELVMMDTMNHEVLLRRSLGMHPRYLGMASNDKYLFVVDADQGLIRAYQPNDFKFIQEVALNVGLNQPQQITLYDSRMAQLIEVELPRYLNDVVRVTQ